MTHLISHHLVPLFLLSVMCCCHVALQKGRLLDIPRQRKRGAKLMEEAQDVARGFYMTFLGEAEAVGLGRKRAERRFYTTLPSPVRRLQVLAPLRPPCGQGLLCDA